MSRFPVTIGTLSEGDRFEFKGSQTITGTVGERDADGVQVWLDVTGQEFAQRRRHAKLETWHASTRVRKIG